MPPAPLNATPRTSRLELPATPREDTAGRPALVVFSDERWSVVYHRPQHLLVRLARDHDVYFVEEPVHDDAGSPHLVPSCPAAGIEVLVPHLPGLDAGFGGAPASLAALSRLLEAFLRERGVRAPIAWLTTPMAAPLAAALSPRAVVYDRADDFSLSNERGVVRAARDATLLRTADLVLTASPTLHAATRRFHAGARWLPDAVDAEHFDPEHLWERSVEAADAAGLHDGMPRPRLGCFGVIDERTDLALLDAVATRRPDWQIVLAGPVLLPDPEAVPRRPNLHWLGRQPWAVLPYVLAQWDVCLHPVVRGPRTRFTSLARPLEYLAGDRPVVSTALPDVVARLGHVVHTADDVDGFVRACENALAEDEAERRHRRAAAREAVARCSWDRGAESLRTWLAPHATAAPGPAVRRPVRGAGSDASMLS